MKYDTETRPAVYDLLQDMNADIREIRDVQYEQHHELTGLNQRVTRLESDVSDLKCDVSTLRQDVAVLKRDVSGLKEDVKELRQDMKDLRGEVKGIAGILGGMQTRLNWWLVIAGIVLALLQNLKG